MGSPRVIAIVGPTAVGKSAVADLVAERIGGEIVSADSMQVYRDMDIGTAKTPPEARRVRYHGIDLVEPGTAFSAALYQAYARAAVDEIRARGRVPVFVGGTGLYVRAALDDMEFPPGDTGTPLRQEIEARAREIGADALHGELAVLDPASAALIHPHNVKRVVRALEMHSEGVSYAEQAARFACRTFHYPETVLVGLTMDRAALYRRIDERVAGMLAQGLLGEVRRLLDAGLREALTAAQAIGYKELVPVVEGTASLEDAQAAIAQATRRYAKRQLTWFRADPRVRWVDVTVLGVAAAAERVLALLAGPEAAS